MADQWGFDPNYWSRFSPDELNQFVNMDMAEGGSPRASSIQSFLTPQAPQSAIPGLPQLSGMSPQPQSPTITQPVPQPVTGSQSLPTLFDTIRQPNYSPQPLSPAIPAVQQSPGIPATSNPQPSPMLTALSNAQTPGTGVTSGVNMGSYLGPIQAEIGNTQTEYNNALQNYLSQRAQQGGQLQTDLTNQMNAGLTAQVPGIEDRLQQLGIAQSGAYPEALAQAREGLLANSILPQLSAFDTQTFNTASQLPLSALNTVQGLQQGSVGRQFSQQDIAAQMQFQQGLADQYNKTLQLSSLLGLVPALIGSGGLPGLMNGGGAFGGRTGTNSSIFGGTGATGGGGGMDWQSLLQGGSGIGSILASGGLGAGAAGLGDLLGMGGAGQGALGGLAALLGGGGIGGGLGAGLGGAFGGALGAGIGGAAGSGLGQAMPDILSWLQGPQMAAGGDMGGLGVTMDPGILNDMNFAPWG